jgi:hypothetical protein
MWGMRDDLPQTTLTLSGSAQMFVSAFCSHTHSLCAHQRRMRARVAATQKMLSA